MPATFPAQTAFAEALKSTAEAAIRYSRGMRKEYAWTRTEEGLATRAATATTLGGITVSAGIAGNSRADHVRYTFKIDGKRASRAEVEKLINA